jgi:hypothetical protein
LDSGEDMDEQIEIQTERKINKNKQVLTWQYLGLKACP